MEGQCKIIDRPALYLTPVQQLVKTKRITRIVQVGTTSVHIVEEGQENIGS